MMKCLYCGKKIPEEEAKKIEEVDVEPFCSQYCAEIYGGVPMPWETSKFYTYLINIERRKKYT